MATRKVTYSLETDAIALAEEAAARAGVSTSAWLSRAARREAGRVGYTPLRAAAREGAEAQAMADEAERAAAEEEMREAG